MVSVGDWYLQDSVQAPDDDRGRDAAGESEGWLRGGRAEAVPRSLLTKRGSWGRPVRRWCEVEDDRLVYYERPDGLEPKGQIALHGCRVTVGSSSPSSAGGPAGVPAAATASCAVRLERPGGKSACEIYVARQRDRDLLMANAVSRPSPTKLPSLPASPCVPEVPPVSSPPRSPETSVPAPRRDAHSKPGLAEIAEPASPRSALGDAAVAPAPRAAAEEWAPAGAAREVALADEWPSSVAAMSWAQGPHISSATAAASEEDCEWAMPDVPPEECFVRATEELIPQTSGGSAPSVEAEPVAGVPRDSPRGRSSRMPASSEGKAGLSNTQTSYSQAIAAIWNFDLRAAEEHLRPWRHCSACHAAALAECAVLKVLVTGCLVEAQHALDLIQSAQALSDPAGGLQTKALAAELALMRCGLQIVLGMRIRALFNLRQSWQLYRSLERHLSDPDAFRAASAAEASLKVREPVLAPDDLRGRICFGLGFFYLATSLLPLSLGPLLRLAGFAMDRKLGKAYLGECVEQDLGVRSAPAAVALAMFHLDLEPDVQRAGAILVASLGRRPENVLLHWAGSLLAWRNTCLTQAREMIDKALWCCGADLSGRAVFLRYELGMLQFVNMQWHDAHDNFRFVYDALTSEKVFFPHKVLVVTQLAAVSFALGRDVAAERLCGEGAKFQEWGATLRLETDLARVLQVFVQRRVACRRLLAFEVIYFLRQFAKIPSGTLQEHLSAVRKVGQPFVEQLSRARAETCGTAGRSPAAAQARDQDPQALVQRASALLIECVILFYLADLRTAATLVGELAGLCALLPPWGHYVSAHGLYWCGRIQALTCQREAAIRSLQQAKSYKKYPFCIVEKISKVMFDLQHGVESI